MSEPVTDNPAHPEFVCQCSDDGYCQILRRDVQAPHRAACGKPSNWRVRIAMRDGVVPALNGRGPGSHLKRGLESLPCFRDMVLCGCNEMAACMDAWGVDGCRDHEPEIVAKMRAGAKQIGGIVWKGYSDILARRLIRLAIRRAEHDLAGL